MQPVRVPRTLPVILSREEAARLIAGASNLKHQAAMSVAYGAGLRVSEIVSLKVSDIDSQRMTLRVQQGNRGPRQPVGQHRQWVRTIDHLVQPRAKEVRRAHPQIP